MYFLGIFAYLILHRYLIFLRTRMFAYFSLFKLGEPPKVCILFLEEKNGISRSFNNLRADFCFSDFEEEMLLLELPRYLECLTHAVMPFIQQCYALI